MPTVDDLRGALGQLADLAPQRCDDTIAARRRHRRDRRRGVTGVVAVAAAALAAAAVLAAAPLAITLDPRPSPTPTATRSASPVVDRLPATTFMFDLEPIVGYRTGDFYTSPTAQAMTVKTPDGRLYATVLLYAPGGVRPERPAGARDVEVNGKPGFYGTLRLVPGYGGPVGAPGAIAWEYQPGAWAVVYGPVDSPSQPSGQPLTEERARQIAEAVRPGRSHAARTSMRLRRLGGNLEVHGVVNRVAYPDPSAGTNALLLLGPKGTSTLSVAMTATAAPAGGCSAGPGHPVTVGAYSGRYRDGSLQLCDQHTYLFLGPLDDTGPVPSLEELTEIVRALTLAADLDDRATWFDATTAVGQ